MTIFGWIQLVISALSYRKSPQLAQPPWYQDSSDHNVNVSHLSHPASSHSYEGAYSEDTRQPMYHVACL